MIAVRCSKYQERPLIGRVTKLTGREVMFDWMVGTYSGTWKEWRGREDGKPVIFSDSVPVEDVVYGPITLHKSKKLPPQTIKELKEVYQK